MIRDYQRKWLDDIYAAWEAGARNVFGTLPTGAGKTFCFVTAIRERAQPAVVIAHRQELVAQAALALNRESMPHSIEAPRDAVRAIVAAEMATHGKSFYNPGASVHVAGVHTLAARGAKIRWARDIKLTVVDEGHHVTNGGGIWHEAVELFPNSVGLFPSAHCIRGDGGGLGRGADGLADALIVGPSERSLISRGYLSDYRIAVPPNDLDMRDVPTGASGDFSPVKLSAAVHASRLLVGNIAETYERRAAGKLWLTFATDLAHAAEIRAAYVALGVRAEIITGKTPIDERADMMRQLREKRILQLVSVDVLGEGTDVPAVEGVSMGRPTQSFQLFSQQKGRMGRVNVAPELAARWDQFTDTERLAHIAAGPKPCGWLHDHVGNFARHYAQRGMPCAPQQYSLARAERRARKAPTDAIPLRTCLNEECYQPYPRTLPACPHCGTPAPAPAGRASPEQVDGDLVLLDPEAMAALVKQIARVDGPVRIPQHLDGPAAGAVVKSHRNRQLAQARLRERMQVWGGWRAHLGESTSIAQRTFFYRFGIDVATAQTLGTREAVDLYERIHVELHANSVHSTELPAMDGVLDMPDEK